MSAKRAKFRVGSRVETIDSRTGIIRHIGTMTADVQPIGLSHLVQYRFDELRPLTRREKGDAR